MDSTRFGLYLMCFNSSYKLILCLMRRLGCLNDKVNAPIAGFISALSMAIDASHRNLLISILTMSRVFDILLKAGETDGVIPTFSGRNLLIWLAANLWCQTAMAYHQSVLGPALTKFYRIWSQQKTNDQI